MAADLETFRTQFPELAATTYADATVERALVEATQIHHDNDLATLYLTAHLLVAPASATASPRGELKSIKVGPMTSQYRTQADEGREAFFTTTSYGKRFLTLEQRTPRTTIGARVC